jgi:cation transport ATPase
MPDVTLLVHGLSETGESERLEKAVSRLGFVELVNADSAKELLAVSYEGGEAELGQIEQAIRDAGYEFEPTPGAQNAGG